MKSITILYNQNQAQKANGNGSGAAENGKENKNSRRTKKDKKAGNSNVTMEENDRASVQERIGMIIHEIRNPLTAISLANQSLREEIQFDNLPSSLNIFTDIVFKNINRIESSPKRPFIRKL